jgi:hypothetical protein
MKRLAALVISFVLSGSMISSRAELKNFRFRGSISRVDDLNAALDGSITNGSPVEGFYIFDTETPDSNPDPTVGDYRSSDRKTGIAVKVGNYVFRTNPRQVDFLIETVNRPEGDNYLLRSYNNICSQPLPIREISWQLDDPSGATADDDSLPLIPPTLSQWQSIFGLTIAGSGQPPLLLRATVEKIDERPTRIDRRPFVKVLDAVEIKWPSQMGYYYQVQRSNDLQHWENIGEPVLGDGGVLSQFVERDARKQYFYRARITNSLD